MSLFFNPIPTFNNLPGATSQLINQPNITDSIIVIDEESNLIQMGGKKTKSSKTVKKQKSKTSKPVKKQKSKTSKPVKKQIDLYKRVQLEKLAKKHKINLKKRDGTLKTKLQLFRSLKRKNLL